MSDLKFLRFEKSNRKNKKYVAILFNKKTKRINKVHFGSSLYEQYKDKTGLKLYSHKDHLDKERRKRYKARHEKTRHKKYSASWFSDKYLW